jgi:CcmD family protein
MKSAGYAMALEVSGEATLRFDQPRGAADPAQRGTEFRPVDAGDTVASGETLLVEAYAILWVILFAFLFLSGRRQTKIDTRVGELERALNAARGAKAP